jgi:acetyltransferase-like isoleucine patch superfamily enzyme
MASGFLNKILIKIVHRAKPLIQFVAYHADLKVLAPWTGQGQHPLIFEDTTGAYKDHIPKSVYFNTRSGRIVVGRNTVFGEDVMVLTGKHRFISEVADEAQLHEVPEDGREIIIGSNCYIGSGAIIIGPVNIGDYAVIGAGSVVTKDVPPRTMYAGIPAKKIKDL